MSKLNKSNLAEFRTIKRDTETTCARLQQLYDKYSQIDMHPGMAVYHRMTPDLIRRCRAIIDLTDYILSTEACTVGELRNLRLAVGELYAIRNALAEEHEEQKKEYAQRRFGKELV